MSLGSCVPNLGNLGPLEVKKKSGELNNRKKKKREEEKGDTFLSQNRSFSKGHKIQSFSNFDIP